MNKPKRIAVTPFSWTVDGLTISDGGMIQVQDDARYLRYGCQFTADRILHSNYGPARETAFMMRAVMGIGSEPEVDDGFNPAGALVETFGYENCHEEARRLEKQFRGTTLALALANSEYLRFAKKRIRSAIINCAFRMREQGDENVLVVSSPMFAELGARDRDRTYLGIKPGEAMMYDVADGEITGTQLFRFGPLHRELLPRPLCA